MTTSHYYIVSYSAQDRIDDPDCDFVDITLDGSQQDIGKITRERDYHVSTLACCDSLADAQKKVGDFFGHTRVSLSDSSVIERHFFGGLIPLSADHTKDFVDAIIDVEVITHDTDLAEIADEYEYLARCEHMTLDRLTVMSLLSEKKSALLS